MTFPTMFVATRNPGIVLTPVTVNIGTSTQNVDVFALAGSPGVPVELTVNVNPGVIVSSAGTGAALSINGFTGGSTFALNVLTGANILGHGGDGGNGGDCESDVSGGICSMATRDGDDGGDAVSCQGSITVDNLGAIRGGGGGGGGGGCGASDSSGSAGGGGGGGVGSNVGAGGAGGLFGPGADDGTDGDSTQPTGTPGTGGAPSNANGGSGGAGADWGASASSGGLGSAPAGANPCTTSPGTGGAAGAAINLASGSTTFITMGQISGATS